MPTDLTPYFELDFDSPADDGEFDAGHGGRLQRTAAWLTGGVVGRVWLTLIALSTVTALATGVTGALLGDEVQMASVTAVGGTLDIVINGDTDDTAVAFGGTGATITTDVSNMAPGDTAWGELAIDNAGTLPLTITVDATGTDTHPDQTTGHCFSYFFREVGAAGATSNGATLASPTLITNMGAAEGPDNQTVLFETPASQQLSDVGASGDVVWETDDTKTYRLTVRMRTECTQGGDAGTGATGPGATGSLSFTFNAAQT